MKKKKKKCFYFVFRVRELTPVFGLLPEEGPEDVVEAGCAEKLNPEVAAGVVPNKEVEEVEEGKLKLEDVDGVGGTAVVDKVELVVAVLM